ncbi:sterol desaturase family protein [Romeriopsis navalis]|nr:sterol desaturase family protein [Romeriopsis navalis]
MELSVGAAVLFGLCAAAITNAVSLGSTLLYQSVNQHSWGYLVFSYVFALMIQDTYFYFLHRGFHHPWLFKCMHQGHHLSGDPTPWTAFAFDPLEVVLQAAFLVAIVYILPLHISVVMALLITMTIWSVWNHLGFELFSADFPRHWLSRWFIGPTHHAIHHRKYRCHFGLYFTIWDRLLGTHDPTYDDDFAGALDRSS